MHVTVNTESVYFQCEEKKRGMFKLPAACYSKVISCHSSKIISKNKPFLSKQKILVCEFKSRSLG